MADIGAGYVYSDKDFPVELRGTLTSPVVINEIMYNDSKTSDSKDWIELYNPTNLTVNISGWIMSDEDSTHQFIFPSGVNINSKGFLVVCKDTTKFHNAFVDSKSFIGNIDFGFDGNDKVQLFDNEGNLKSFVSYRNSSPWPVEPDGTGASLELCNPYGINYKTINWKTSLDKPTPGKQNSVYAPTGLQETIKIPDGYYLTQNFPNPFNPTTTIEFQIPKQSLVELKIYDILGREIQTLVNKVLEAGDYTYSFDAGNLASGIYLYKLKVNSFVQVKKMILLR